MRVASLFSGCGGMDLGFERAGFEIIWANDNAPSVWDTYRSNFQEVCFDKRSLTKIPSHDVPDNIDGIIGGPPCQSWSNAGSGRGIDDKRGRLFFDFIRIISDKNPLFFVAENVEGLLAKRNKHAFERIKSLMESAGRYGYSLSVETLNAAHYDVPQNRKRVFFVGYRKDIGIKFEFPNISNFVCTVRSAIYDIKDSATPGNLTVEKLNKKESVLENHEYWEGTYSYIFMSRNRVLSWDAPSYTLQASGRQTPIHPSAPKMQKVAKDVMQFVPGMEHLYRRLSIRECARLQTFPDTFKFKYVSLNAGYKMIGNSVPVNLANHLAKQIALDFGYKDPIEDELILSRTNTVEKLYDSLP